MWGVFFYNLALPLVIVSMVLFWIPSFKMKDNLDLLIRIYYKGNINSDIGYRRAVLYMAHIVPGLAFIIDMIFNKIRIPIFHAIYSAASMGIYYLISLIGQAVQDNEAIFYDSLNWSCKRDFSYLVNRTDSSVLQTNLKHKPCADGPGEAGREDFTIHNQTMWKHFDCYSLYRYYCHHSEDMRWDEANQTQITTPVEQKYDSFQNRDRFILVTILVVVAGHLLFSSFHNWKARDVKGFNKGAFIKKRNEEKRKKKLQEELSKYSVFK